MRFGYQVRESEACYFLLLESGDDFGMWVRLGALFSTQQMHFIIGRPS